MRGRVTSAKTELADLERRLAQRSSALQKMRAEIADIGRLISAANADAMSKRAALAAQKAANSATQVKIDEIVAERDKLQRMTRELEETNRQEALLHQRLKKKKDGEAGQETIVADIERRAKDADRQFADAGARLERLKAAARQIRL
jgi:chromosome segregation ATPase